MACTGKHFYAKTQKLLGNNVIHERTGTVCSAAGDLSKDVEEEKGNKMKSVFAAHGKRRGVRGGGIEQAVGEEKKCFGRRPREESVRTTPRRRRRRRRIG